MARIGSDIVAALLLAGFSTISAIYLYGNYAINMGYLELVRGELPNQEVFYRIEQNSRCVGVIKIVPYDEELFGLAIRGDVWVGVDDRTDQLHFKGENMFNPLGQLINSHYQIDGPNGRFSLSSSGVDKLDVAIEWSNVGGGTGGYRIRLPGPIILKRKGKGGQFSISTPWGVTPEYRSAYLDLPTNLGLSFKESADVAPCRSDGQDSLELMDLLGSFVKSHPQYRSIVSSVLSAGSGPTPKMDR